MPLPLATATLTLAALFGAAGEITEREAALRTRVDVLLLSHDARDPDARLTLARELYELGPAVAPYLCDLLKRGEIGGAATEPAALVVGKLGQLDSLSALTRLARGDDPEDRRAGLAGLGLMNRREAVPVLARAVGDPVGPVSDQAERSLLATDVPRAEVVKIISRNLELSRDRARLARILAALGGDEARDVLLDTLALDELAALQGLQRLGDPAVGEPVLDLLQRSFSSGVRKQAALCLGHLGHRPAVRDLIELLDSEDPGLAVNAHWSLQRITGQTFKRDLDVWLRWWELVGQHQDV